MTRKVDLKVPNPANYQADEQARYAYDAAQRIMAIAIQLNGVPMGISYTLSGITRELRRHLSIAEAQELLHQLADTLPEAAKWDRVSAPDRVSSQDRQ